MNASVADYAPHQNGIAPSISEASCAERKFSFSAESHNLDGIRFEFDQQMIPLGSDSFLKLWHKPMIKLSPHNFELEVEHWGIRVQLQESATIPREIGRQFLRLWRKAQNDILTEQDEALWGEIIDQVDVAQYASDIAPAQYIEAQLLDNGLHPLVRLHDGQNKRLPMSAVPKLGLVNKGEWFSAYVRFNKDLSIHFVDQIELIGILPTIEDFGTWPTPPSA